MTPEEYEQQVRSLWFKMNMLISPPTLKVEYKDFIDEAEEEVRQLDEILISCPDSRTLMVSQPGHDPKTWRVR